MTDDISISYTHSSATEATPSTSTAQSQELYAFVDCELIGFDAEKMLVINRITGEQQFFQPGVVEALKTCTQFKTLQNHAQGICSARPELSGQEAAVESTLSVLASSGFLLSESTIRSRLVLDDAPQSSPSRVFIITCDRPEAVERLLESMLRNSNLAVHDQVYLIDDSRDPVNQARNDELVTDFNIRSPRDLVYVGQEMQERLISFLVEKLPEEEAGIRFLIDRSQWVGKKTYGRSRTLALLLSVGYRAIVLDDDILCEAVAPPIHLDGVSFDGQRQACFYGGREELMQSAHPAGVDPLQSHLGILGHQLGSTLATVSDGGLPPGSMLDCNAAMLNELAPNHPVLITQCGSWGDPGTGGAHWCFHLDESSIERLVSAPNGMADALENRSSWLGCPRLTLHKMAFMSQMTGLDNRELLPPYFPAFRGEDLMFATMVEAMFPKGAILELGWSVPHLPTDNRAYSVRDPIVGEGGIVLFTRWLVSQIDYKKREDPQHSLHNIAALARGLASRSDDDLLLDYRREQAKGQADLLLSLTSQYKAAEDLPAQSWKAYLKRALEETEQSITEIHSPEKIKGVSPGTTNAELVREFRELAHGWAAALEAWPAMRGAMNEFS